MKGQRAKYESGVQRAKSEVQRTKSEGEERILAGVGGGGAADLDHDLAPHDARGLGAAGPSPQPRVPTVSLIRSTTVRLFGCG
jgi:hypothetical protein